MLTSVHLLDSLTMTTNKAASSGALSVVAAMVCLASTALARHPNLPRNDDDDLTFAESETPATVIAAQAQGSSKSANTFSEDDSLNYEIEVFFTLLLVLFAVIALVKIRESQLNTFRYEPL